VSLSVALPIIIVVIILMTFINFRYSRLIWMYLFTWGGGARGEAQG
jgi:hypothetical protein